MDRDRALHQLNQALLYGILDTGYVAETELESVTESLLDGGIGILQFRAKGYSESAVLKLLTETAPRILTLCRAAEVPFIINDFPRVAQEIGADGVHIGQDDGSIADARAIVGDSLIIGRSTHSPAQALAAHQEGFDYIGFGPLFPTPTKKGRPGIGLENIPSVQQKVGAHIPVFCIGGIKPENLNLVLASGARRVVIVSSLLQSQNIHQTTSHVVATLDF